jgi:CBS domain-containing protein
VTLVPSEPDAWQATGAGTGTYRQGMETTRKVSVHDIMSAPLVIVRDYDTIWHAVDRFVATGLHHLVVLDPDDALVGVLEDRGVLAEWPLDAAGMHHRTIGELLRSREVTGARGVPRTHPAVSVRHAGLLMLDLRVDALAVVNDFGKVVGILTSTDLIRYLVEDSE